MKIRVFTLICTLLLGANAGAQIGKQFPSERKVVKDPVTGTMLTFLTSKPHGDSKIYPTHPQWTADGKWVIFRSQLARGEAMAVNEASGEIIQVSEGGYIGMLNAARKSNKLYFLRKGANATEVVEVNLERVFADSKSGKMQAASAYQRVCGELTPEMGAGGDAALDANDDWLYFRVSAAAAARHLPPGTRIEPNFGPRNMGAGPTGIARMNVATGEIRHVVSVPFQVGHIQSNLWNPGEIVFSWETGGKSPQRTWTVKADGSGLRPLYPEASYEWVTHEAIIGKDEVAMAIMGHRPVPDSGKTEAGTEAGGANPGQDAAWGNTGTREKPTGLAIVNLRTREMAIAGQTPSGSGLWHVHGSKDGHWAVGDDFSRNLYLIDRNTRKMKLLSAGHKTTAADHPHPTFSEDGKRIQIPSEMLSEDNRSINIVIIPVPESLE